jgi:hypothetical protein
VASEPKKERFWSAWRFYRFGELIVLSTAAGWAGAGLSGIPMGGRAETLLRALPYLAGPPFTAAALLWLDHWFGPEPRLLSSRRKAQNGHDKNPNLREAPDNK